MIINNTVSKNKPVQWGMQTKPLSQVSAFPNMNTRTTTPPMTGTPAPMKSIALPKPQTGLLSPVQDLSQGYKPAQPSAPQPRYQLQSQNAGTSNPSMGTSTPTQSNNMPTGTPMGTSNKTKGVIDYPSKKDNQRGFTDFTSGLLGASKPSKDQKKYLQELEKATQASKKISDDARATATKYSDEIARVGQLGAGAVAGNLSTGSNVVGSGNAAIASQSASNRIGALSTALASEMQGTGQQLTAAEQGITGMTNALQGANTQSQLGIQALGTGGGLAMPSPSAYGQTIFDPLTGSFAGGNMDPQMQAQSLAQQVMGGRMTYDQALASLGYAGQAGTNFLNNAITGAGGNPLQLQAMGAGQQANVATQTTAGTDIARQGLGQATQDYVQMNTAAQFANQQSAAVSNILAQTGLNNVSSTDYNKALNTIKGKFSDVNFASLNTALTEAQVAYTNLLSTGGGTPSGREMQALNTLNINQSAGAISASIRELENAVSRRLQAQYGALQTYQQNLGGGGQSQYGGGGSTGPITWDSLLD